MSVLGTEALELKLGKVKWFNTEKGYGFLTPIAGGNDVFIHAKSLRKCGVSTLVEGEMLKFKENAGPKGNFATDLSVVTD